MFFICDYERKHLVANSLEKLGVAVQNFSFDKNGLQTWRYKA
jgi:D-glycero-alpha-D-manno-heptose-7-phosphate kinase